VRKHGLNRSVYSLSGKVHLLLCGSFLCADHVEILPVSGIHSVNDRWFYMIWSNGDVIISQAVPSIWRKATRLPLCLPQMSHGLL
jgi:hypothetical protein